MDGRDYAVEIYLINTSSARQRLIYLKKKTQIMSNYLFLVCKSIYVPINSFRWIYGKYFLLK